MCNRTGRNPGEATIVESFDAIDDAFEALDSMAERLHERGIDPESFGFRGEDRLYRPIERPRMHGAVMTRRHTNRGCALARRLREFKP